MTDQERREYVKQRIEYFFEAASCSSSDWFARNLLAMVDEQGNPLLAVLAEDQSLPEIPSFAYEHVYEEIDPTLLCRGAIGYKERLLGFRRVIL